MPPGAAKIALDAGTIFTPVGQFHITKVDETEITFDDPRQVLKVFGRLDRMTGQMTIFWRTAEEEAKIQAGRKSTASMYSELSCTVAKPLF